MFCIGLVKLDVSGFQMSCFFFFVPFSKLVASKIPGLFLGEKLTVLMDLDASSLKEH
jgi:hypothetical protein